LRTSKLHSCDDGSGQPVRHRRTRNSRSDSTTTPVRPNRRFEGVWKRRGYSIVAGVDEAGRGCLAGPVVAGAVILGRHVPEGLNDSKKLSPLRREALLQLLIDSDAHLAWGAAEPEEIDQINIREASFLAMSRAIERLAKRPEALLVDGFEIPHCKIPQRHLIKGDCRSLSIAAASIVAKVVRDKMLIELSERYPEYGFAVHKGYPTAKHRAALARLGPVVIHRQSFGPVRLYSTQRPPIDGEIDGTDETV
jgi:ribonuclease HII